MIQADQMAEELDTASKTDYKSEGLPLLMHQVGTILIWEIFYFIFKDITKITV